MSDDPDNQPYAKWEPDLKPEEEARAQELRDRWRPAIEAFVKFREHIGMNALELPKSFPLTEQKAIVDLSAIVAYARHADATVSFTVTNKDGETLDLMNVFASKKTLDG